MFFANSSSKQVSVKLTNTDSELLDFLEIEIPIDTPLHYITRFACERFDLDQKKLSL